MNDEEQDKIEQDNNAVAVAEPPEGHEPAEAPDAAVAEATVATAEAAATPGEAAPTAVPAAPVSAKRWYVVKVQSGREESIKNALERRVKIEGLEEFIGRVLIPTEKVTELRGGKRVVKKRKKFPGYLMCEVEFNDRVLYLFRETSGVGDFVGGSLHKLPTPMNDREVERMLMDEEEKPAGKGGEEITGKKKIIIPYAVNDRVKVRDGTFKDMEGEVKEIIDPSDPKENPKVKVVLTIWGRPVDVEVEYWQVDPV
jgi:transcription termination/antitermination protein NusG